MLSIHNSGWLLSSVVFLNGCVSVALNAGFDEVKAAYNHMAAGAHFGKIVIRVG